MADKVRIVIDKKAIGKWLRTDDSVAHLLLDQARDVASEAAATASEAENGSGGELDGYASAGFSVDIMQTPTRQAAIIASNAAPETALAVHFYTQRRDGIGHLRAALYKFTNMRGVKRYPIGKNYSSQPPSKG